MGAPRVIGIETEYGISVPGQPFANPMILSGQVVLAYARANGDSVRRVVWDYSGESPLTDARGFEIPRNRAHLSQLTDEAADDPTIATAVLTNGARLYVDHAHPEYSAPEAGSVLEALAWDRAGELVMAEAADLLARGVLPSPGALTGSRSVGGRERAPAGPPVTVRLYKNNTDGKGASYGTHENYLLRRTTPFARIATGILPFFVVRQILCGAGRVGIGQKSEVTGYQLSSRADFMEAEVGLETTFNRPIVNTRDEPHADPGEYRRLHVIVGDANLCDVAGLLKLGTTSLVLDLIEADELGEDLALAAPVADIRHVSHDPGLQYRVRLLDGRRMTGLELLWEYYERCRRFVDAGRVDEGASGEESRLILDRWEEVLTDLEADPARCADRIDWVAKLAVLQGYRDRDDLSWSDPRLAAVDIQWSDVRPGKGVARRLESAGRIERLIPEGDVAAAVEHPPESTRAWFRGECVRRYRGHVAAASWESVVFDIPGQDHLLRIPTMEPRRGTRQLLSGLLDASADAAALVAQLRGG